MAMVLQRLEGMRSVLWPHMTHSKSSVRSPRLHHIQCPMDNSEPGSEDGSDSDSHDRKDLPDGCILLSVSASDLWDRGLNLNLQVLLDLAMGESVHISGAEGDVTVMVDEDPTPVEDDGEWPDLEFL
jgi:hypothetical protein